MCESQPLLGGLPSEIIVSIIDHVLEFPGRPNSHGDKGLNVLELLGHSLMRTSRQLRAHALTMLVERCLWVRLFSGDSEDWPNIRNWFPYIPNLPETCFSVLHPEQLKTLEIKLATSELSSETDGREQSNATSLLFPFSPEVWFRFSDDLKHEIRHMQPKNKFHISIRFETITASMQEVVEIYILPTLFNYQLQPLSLLRLEGRGFHQVEDRDKIPPRQAQSLETCLAHVHSVLNHADLLRRHHRLVDSTYVLLHTRAVGNRVTSWLRTAWWWKRTAIESSNSPDSRREILAKANELHRLLQETQFRIVSAAYQLYHIKGGEWIRAHEYLTENCARWAYGSEFRWPGLRRRELARVELATALIMMMRIAILDESVISVATPLLNVSVRSLQAKAMACEYTASRLWPNMPELEWLDEFRQVEKDDSTLTQESNTQDDYIEIHNAGGTQYMWSGSRNALAPFGGDLFFRTLDEDRHRMGDKENVVEEYCDRECRCIIY